MTALIDETLPLDTDLAGNGAARIRETRAALLSGLAAMQVTIAESLETMQYNRNTPFKVTSPSVRQTLNTPSVLIALINGIQYIADGSSVIDLDVAASWDNAAYADAAARAGKDFYIYICEPVSGNIPVYVLSANSTYPTGYTALNSRKIGGFHCLCVAVGTTCYAFNNSRSDLSVLDDVYVTHDFALSDTSRHWLKNYIAGDILPFSIWDIRRRPLASPEGKVFDANSNIWVDIYLPSLSGGLLKSVYNAVPTSGGLPNTAPNLFHQYKYAQQFRQQRQFLLKQHEFVSMSLGSPQGENIAGSAMPAGTGGCVAVSRQRIISNIGVEDATGVFWQWGDGQSLTGTGVAYANAYDGNDLNVAGQHYQQPNPPIFGGGWNHGVNCGSRAAVWSNAALSLDANVSGRGGSPVSGHN